MVKKLEQAACAENGLSRSVACRNMPEGFLDFSCPPGLSTWRVYSYHGVLFFFFPRPTSMVDNLKPVFLILSMTYHVLHFTVICTTKAGMP